MALKWHQLIQQKYDCRNGSVKRCVDTRYQHFFVDKSCIRKAICFVLNYLENFVNYLRNLMV
jgi:hypothetical protein